MKLPLPSITSLEVKDAGKLRRRNRPAQLMTAVGELRTTVGTGEQQKLIERLFDWRQATYLRQFSNWHIADVRWGDASDLLRALRGLATEVRSAGRSKCN
jgi:hypothetical protein